MRVLMLLVLGFASSVWAASSENLATDGPSLPEMSWKKQLCIAKGMQVREFFTFRRQGVPRDMLLEDPRMEQAMTGEQQAEIRDLIRQVYDWQENPRIFVDNVYKTCMTP